MPEQQRATIETHHRVVELKLEEHTLLERLEDIRGQRRELEDRLRAVLGQRFSVDEPAQVRANKAGTRTSIAAKRGPQKSEESQAVLGFMRSQRPKGVSIKDLKAQPWASKKNRNGMSQIVHRLKKSGLVKQTGHGKWTAI